jgi:DNA-binding HxlR family transcriptional regulator
VPGLADALGRTPRTLRNQLEALVDAGFVAAVGTSANDPTRRYRLTKHRDW